MRTFGLLEMKKQLHFGTNQGKIVEDNGGKIVSYNLKWSLSTLDRATANCLVRSQSLNSIKSKRRFSRRSSSFNIHLSFLLCDKVSFATFAYFGQLLALIDLHFDVRPQLILQVLLLLSKESTLIGTGCYLHHHLLLLILLLLFSRSWIFNQCHNHRQCHRPYITTCGEGNFFLSIAGRVKGSGGSVSSLVRQPSKNRSLSILYVCLSWQVSNYCKRKNVTLN